jgi:hypothetical protein
VTRRRFVWLPLLRHLFGRDWLLASEVDVRTAGCTFDLLRVASQHAHRWLGDVGEDVLEAGALDIPGGVTALSTPSGPPRR